MPLGACIVVFKSGSFSSSFDKLGFYHFCRYAEFEEPELEKGQSQCRNIIL
jgi:hypothetical protein